MSKRKVPGSEGGFTLVELMVVIVLIGLFAGVVGVTVAPMIFKARKAVALDQMKELEKAIQLYHLEQGQYPETLEDLTQATDDNPEGYMYEIPLDPWKEPYEYDPAGGTRKPYALYSKGEDKVGGTDDDVSLETEREERTQ
jgi:general secretion pathway protein G